MHWFFIKRLRNLEKYASRYKYKICADAKEVILYLLNVDLKVNTNDWIDQCNVYRHKYRWVSEWEHPDKDGFIKKPNRKRS